MVVEENTDTPEETPSVGRPDTVTATASAAANAAFAAVVEGLHSTEPITRTSSNGMNIHVNFHTVVNITQSYGNSHEPTPGMN